MPVKLNLKGKRFGRLLVGEQASSKPVSWNCQCDCGTLAVVRATYLTTKRVASCGCLQREARYLRTKHGHARFGQVSPLHVIWRGMRARCENPRNARYLTYGARGITVCERWKVFANFLADVGEPPPGKTPNGRAIYSLDRIDNDRGYEPGNVRWATNKEQSNRTTRSRYVTYRGITKTLREWEEARGIPRNSLRVRLERGASIGKALGYE